MSFKRGDRGWGLRRAHELLNMVLLIPKGVRDHQQPFDKLAKSQFVRHSDAAMQLDGTLRNKSRSLAADGLGG